MKRVIIFGLKPVLAEFQTIDLNRPLIPQPQTVSFSPHFMQLSEQLVPVMENVDDSERIQFHITENLNYKHSFQIEFQTLVLQNAPQKDLPPSIGMKERFAALGSESKVKPPSEVQLDQAYFLVVNAEFITVEALTDRGIFYGLTTLSQLIHRNQKQWVIQQVEILDYPRFELRGTTDQLCHGQVGTVESLKRLIRFLARYKNNMLGVNLEDVMLFEKWPHIGIPRGALTGDEIQTLTDYAQQYYIEFFPGFQGLGHLENFLYHPEFRDLAEFPGAGTLNLADPRSREQLEEWYTEVCEKFSSQYIHIACDEAYDIGQHASKSFIQEKGLANVVRDHVLWLHDLLHKRKGREILMYHDTIMKFSPENLDQLPRDIKIIYWNYLNLPRYGSVKILADKGFFVFVSPSIINWTRPFPHLKHAQKNIVKISQYGAKNGARGFMNSIWGDFNNENLRELNYFGLALGSSCAWNPEAFDEDIFQRAFLGDFFGMHNTHLMWDLLQLINRTNRGGAWNTPFFNRLWSHPISPQKPSYSIKHAKKDRKTMALANEMLQTAIKTVIRNRDVLDYLHYVIDITAFNADKALFSHRQLPYWKKHGIIAPRLIKTAKQLQLRLQELWGQYRDLWLRCAKSEGLERIEKNKDAVFLAYGDAVTAWSKGELLSNPFLPSEWIVHPTEKNRGTPHIFRTSFELSTEDISQIDYARIQCIANSHLKLHVNTQYVGEVISRFFLSPVIFDNAVKIFDIAPYLKPGKNIIEVEGFEYTESLLTVNAYGEVALSSGKKLILKTDNTWGVSANQSENTVHWDRARSLGAPPAINDEIWLPNLEKQKPSLITRNFGKRGYTESIIFMTIHSRKLARFLAKFG